MKQQNVQWHRCSGDLLRDSCFISNYKGKIVPSVQQGCARGGAARAENNHIKLSLLLFPLTPQARLQNLGIWHSDPPGNSCLGGWILAFHIPICVKGLRHTPWAQPDRFSTLSYALAIFQPGHWDWDVVKSNSLAGSGLINTRLIFDSTKERVYWPDPVPVGDVSKPPFAFTKVSFSNCTFVTVKRRRAVVSSAPFRSNSSGPSHSTWARIQPTLQLKKESCLFLLVLLQQKYETNLLAGFQLG